MSGSDRSKTNPKVWFDVTIGGEKGNPHIRLSVSMKAGVVCVHAQLFVCVATLFYIYTILVTFCCSKMYGVVLQLGD